MHDSLTEQQIEQITEAISVTFGDHYNINNWQPLIGGNTNFSSYEANINDKHLIVFKFLDKNKTDIQRYQERICTQRASDMDISPTLYYYDDKDNLLLMEKSVGTQINSNKINTPEVQIAIASQLNIWQQADNKNILNTPSILETTKKLFKQLSNAEISALKITDINEILSPWINYIDNNKYLPCHGDLNPSNIILLPSGTVHFIDWSHAGMNEPWLDFCMISQYLSNDNINYWYNLINEHKTNKVSEQKFKAYNILLTAHCCFWALNQAKQITKSQHIDLEQAILKQQVNTTISELQKNWLNGNFNNNDYQSYITLAKLMLAKISNIPK